MARIDDLISGLPEGNDKAQIIDELARFRKRIGFGVKWEEHEEYIPLWGLPIEANSMVVKWNLPYVTRDGGFQGYIVESSVQPDELDIVQLQQALQDDNEEHPEAEDEEALRVLIESCGGCTTIRPHGGGDVEHVLTRTLVRIAIGQEEIIPLLRHLQTIVHPDAEEVSTTHAVIESENIVALHLLRSTHRRSFDLIYLDPPYNAQQKDWKYNNDYVDPKDGYKHSRWMSFIDHRLKIAKELLAEDGVVVVAIDENEIANLVLLLHKLWPDMQVTVIPIRHNPKGIQGDDFSIMNDYAVFVHPKGRISKEDVEDLKSKTVLLTGQNAPKGVYSPRAYPVVINEHGIILEIGEAPGENEVPNERNVVRENGDIEVWPLDSDGDLRRWRLNPATLQERLDRGWIFATNKGHYWDIDEAKTEREYGSLWTSKKYDNQSHGTRLLDKVFENRPFNYPKSIYTMADVILAATKDRPEAKVLDFFGGSGTTLHATMVVNAMDGGERQCILVSASEVNGKITDPANKTRKIEHWSHLVTQGFTPLDNEWLQEGVIRSATLPRLEYFTRGTNENNEAIKGSYEVGFNHESCREIAFLQIPTATEPITVKRLLGESVGHNSSSYVSTSSSIAALWDSESDEHQDSFIESIGNLNVTAKLQRVFIRTDNDELYNLLVTRVREALPQIPESQANSRAMSLGFPNQAIECFQLIYGDRISLLYNDDFTSMREISWLYARSTQRYQNPPEDYAIATEDGQMIGSADGAIIHHGFERQYESALASSIPGGHVISLPHTLLEYASHARILPNQKIGGEDE